MQNKQQKLNKIQNEQENQLQYFMSEQISQIQPTNDFLLFDRYGEYRRDIDLDYFDQKMSEQEVVESEDKGYLEFISVHNDVQQFKIRKNFIDFSELLLINDFNKQTIGLGNQQLSAQQRYTRIRVPSGIPLHAQIIDVLQNFMNYCQYSPQLIILKPINSFHSAYSIQTSCSSQINMFMNKFLDKMTNKQIREILEFSRYFRVHKLIDVVEWFLAKKYMSPFTIIQAKQKLIKYGVDRDNKSKYAHFAKQLKIKQQYYHFFQFFNKKMQDVRAKKAAIKQQHMRKIKLEEQQAKKKRALQNLNDNTTNRNSSSNITR